MWLIVVIGTVAIAVAHFTDALSKLWDFVDRLHKASKSPTAHIEAESQPDGSSKVVFTFTDVREGFAIDTIVMQLNEMEPAPKTEAPSKTVETVHYDVLVPETILQDFSAQLQVRTAMYHDPKEPFARLSLNLWWEKPASSVKFRMKPIFQNAKRQTLDIPTNPQELQIELEHRVGVTAIPATTIKAKSENR